MRSNAKLKLVRTEGRKIGAEIVTTRRLETQRIVGREVATPEEYLPSAPFWITARAASYGEGRRYICVVVQAPIDGLYTSVVDRFLDLSAGSKERELAGLLARQERMDLVWVNDGITVARELRDSYRREWLKALENSRDVSFEQYVRELAALDHEPTEWPAGVARLFPRPRRVAQPRARPVPFFAKRTGRIPRTGRATVAGIRCPQAADPFTHLPAHAHAAEPARLLLVPCNRPADTIAVIGGLDREVAGPKSSAVLRSWEERFGSVPVAVEPSHAWKAVDRPPTDFQSGDAARR